MAMAWRASMPAGRRSSQSAGTRAACAKPPQRVSPRPQPLSSTASPGLKRGSALRRTVPAKSMPGTMGKLRTTGDLPVIARASL
ncbi:hypothetical protein D9M72_279870 [compost metagenome]